jgi:hypothetical protein
MNQKLIDLAVWLRANPVPNLNMQKWCSENEYGTTYCIMGWVAKNNMFGFYLNDIEIPCLVDSDPDSESSWEAIRRGFNIDQDTAGWLFLRSYARNLTFDQIVDRIERVGKY